MDAQLHAEGVASTELIAGRRHDELRRYAEDPRLINTARFFPGAPFLTFELSVPHLSYDLNKILTAAF